MTQNYPLAKNESMEKPLSIFDMMTDAVNDHADNESPHPNGYFETLEGYWFDMWEYPEHVKTIYDWLTYMMANTERQYYNEPMYYSVVIHLDRPAVSVDFSAAIQFINTHVQILTSHYTDSDYVILPVSASPQVTPAMILLLAETAISTHCKLERSNIKDVTINTIDDEYYSMITQK